MRGPMPRRRGLRPRLLAAVIPSKATLAFAAERQVVSRMGIFGIGRKPAVAQILRSDPRLSDSLDPLWERVGDTIAWCRAHLDLSQPQQCLRREETRPRVLERDYFTAVSVVASLRRHRTRNAQEERSLAGGRVLVYFPDEELADGAAEAESEGFFDVSNAPPWDTWLAMVEDAGQRARSPYLLAWVPDELIHPRSARHRRESGGVHSLVQGLRRGDATHPAIGHRLTRNCSGRSPFLASLGQALAAEFQYRYPVWRREWLAVPNVRQRSRRGARWSRKPSRSHSSADNAAPFSE
jgi:hypothetical protein